MFNIAVKWRPEGVVEQRVLHVLPYLGRVNVIGGRRARVYLTVRVVLLLCVCERQSERKCSAVGLWCAFVCLWCLSRLCSCAHVLFVAAHRNKRNPLVSWDSSPSFKDAYSVTACSTTQHRTPHTHTPPHGVAALHRPPSFSNTHVVGTHGSCVPLRKHITDIKRDMSRFSPGCA